MGIRGYHHDRQAHGRRHVGGAAVAPDEELCSIERLEEIAEVTRGPTHAPRVQSDEVLMGFGICGTTYEQEVLVLAIEQSQHQLFPSVQRPATESVVRPGVQGDGPRSPGPNSGRQTKHPANLVGIGEPGATCRGGKGGEAVEFMGLGPLIAHQYGDAASIPRLLSRGLGLETRVVGEHGSADAGGEGHAVLTTVGVPSRQDHEVDAIGVSLTATAGATLAECRD